MSVDRIAGMKDPVAEVQRRLPGLVFRSKAVRDRHGRLLHWIVDALWSVNGIEHGLRDLTERPHDVAEVEAAKARIARGVLVNLEARAREA